MAAGLNRLGRRETTLAVTGTVVSRQPVCGLPEARSRAKIVRMYLDLAQVAAAEFGDEARNVAAGNAALAGIAASDAICCVRLNKRHRGQDPMPLT
jgi:hypothetical protein